MLQYFYHDWKFYSLSLYIWSITRIDMGKFLQRRPARPDILDFILCRNRIVYSFLRYYFKRHTLIDRAMSIALIFSLGIWIYFILNQLESYRTIIWWEGTNKPWIVLEVLISFYLWVFVYGITYFLLKFFKKNP